MEKYLIASSGDTLESKVSGRFGHSVYYLVVDPQSMEYESFPGVEKYEDQNIAEFIKPGINKIILGNIGPAAFNMVKSYGCKIYLCRNMAVPEAIKKVKNGEIPELNKPTIKDSIHSARKTGYKYGGHGEHRTAGRGTSLNQESMSARGPGKGVGRGSGRGSGMGQRVGRGGGRGVNRKW